MYLGYSFYDGYIYTDLVGENKTNYGGTMWPP